MCVACEAYVFDCLHEQISAYPLMGVLVCMCVRVCFSIQVSIILLLSLLLCSPLLSVCMVFIGESQWQGSGINCFGSFGNVFSINRCCGFVEGSQNGYVHTFLPMKNVYCMCASGPSLCSTALTLTTQTHHIHR